MNENYFENIESLIGGGVIDVRCSYRIVQKEETKALINLLGKCKALYDGFFAINGDISIEDIDTTKKVANTSIIFNLNRLFNYYHRNYDVEFYKITCFSDLHWIEFNVAQICEKVKSWED